MTYKFKKAVNFLWSRDELKKALRKSRSMTELCVLLRGKYSYCHARTLKRYINHYDLWPEAEHWKKYKPWHFNKTPGKYDGVDIFIENSPASNSVLVRTYRKLYPPKKCSECGIPPFWNGKPLTLHLDHINGHGTDWRLDNCRYLCPNCHHQTDTHGSKRGYIKRSAENLKSPHEVAEAFDELQDYKLVGEMFGMSDRAVKNMVNKFNANTSTK